MSGHVHAELMARYAEDARETNEPWKLWEVDNGSGWVGLNKPPSWYESIKYRRKRVPREFWINVYHSRSGIDIGALHKTKESADAGRTHGGETIHIREVIEDED